jgi:gamma-glutamyltranspeptidase/glutathione hydrolase
MHSVWRFVVMLSVGTAAFESVAATEPAAPASSKGVVRAKQGMVCCAHPLAAQAGLEILKNGGNAVDAAIAVNAALTVLEPMSCGAGGDLFAIVRMNGDPKVHGLNASGRSPKAATRAWFREKGHDEIPLFGPLSWSVPGCVQGWEDLRAKFGSKPLAELLEPAARLAEKGAPVPPVIAGYWRAAEGKFRAHPDAAAIYAPGGRIPKSGEVFRNPAYARTLRLIGKEGPAAFYKGSIARRLDEYSKAKGGLLRAADLAASQSDWVDPVSASYRGYDVWQIPPPDQGIAALQMLNLLEGFDVRALKAGSAAWWHHFLEAKKLVYADRAKYYADPAFAQVPVAELISKPYADARRKLLNRERAAEAVDAGDPRLRTGDTTYLSVVDKDRNCVSLIQSLYHGFGSGDGPPDLGFVLQNRGTLFALDENHANRLEPGRRPFHTIIPSLVTKDGKPWLVFGVMGGDMQPQGHVQVLVNLIDFGMNVHEAGAAPRLEHVGSATPTGKPAGPKGGEVQAEPGIPDAVVRDLVRRGHVVKRVRVNGGGFQGILIDPETGDLLGGSEPRKDGRPLGY